MPYSKKSSVIIIGFLEFLERFSYFGVRSLIILFSFTVFDLETDHTFSLYSKAMILVFILPLPAGIISDKFLKQKPAILYGGLIALLGYLMLITKEMLPVGIGLILAIIGTSLIRPNLTVLVGRLFEKTDKNRDFAFLFYHFLINCGAFISVLIVGYISDRYGYKYGFMVTAYAMLKFLIIYSYTKDQFPLIEENINKNFVELNQVNDTVLDAEMTQNEKANPEPFILIGIITLITILFWQIYEMNGTTIQEFILQNPDENFGIFSSTNYLQFAAGLISLSASIIFLIVFYLQGIGSTILKMCLAMILVGTAGLVVANISSFPLNNLPTIFGLTILSYSIGEVFISPFAYSYITRLSDIRYSSTMVGGFICLTGAGSHLLYYISQAINSPIWIGFLGGFSILVGVVLIFYRKRLLKMSGGLD